MRQLTAKDKWIMNLAEQAFRWIEVIYAETDHSRFSYEVILIALEAAYKKGEVDAEG